MQSLSTGYIDSHAHIYLPEFDGDRGSIVDSAKKAGISTILMPAIDSGTHDQMLQTEKEFPNCLSMMGLHPCSVTNDPTSELNIVRDFFATRSFIAVGEIGLDFYWDKTFTEQQYDAFHQQMGLAAELDLPICIHSRNATDECIEVVKQYPSVKGVFHCFSGNKQQAEEIISIGWLLGIGGVVTFKNAGLDKIITDIGISSVILETDAPYLAPVPFRGKRNESSYLRYVWEKLSGLLQMTEEEIQKITTDNCKKLFRL
jgi:TatD DNase family protein